MFIHNLDVDNLSLKGSVYDKGEGFTFVFKVIKHFIQVFIYITRWNHFKPFKMWTILQHFVQKKFIFLEGLMECCTKQLDFHFLCFTSVPSSFLCVLVFCQISTTA